MYFFMLVFKNPSTWKKIIPDEIPKSSKNEDMRKIR